MKITDLFKREKKSKKDDESWKRLKDSVDKIFDNTDKERKEMTRMLEHYNGKIWDEKNLRDDESRAKINLFFSTVQSIAPMLLDNRPIWSLIAKKGEYQVLANAYNRALKYAWDVMDMNMITQEVVVDGMIMKVGLFKVYYDYANGFGGEVCIECVDPRDFFIAPGYSDPWKAPMCGVKIKKPLSYFRNRFPEAKDIKPDTDDEIAMMKKAGIEYGTAQGFELQNYFATLYEVWMEDDETEEEFNEDMQGPEDEKKSKKKRKAYPNGKFEYFTSNQYLGPEASDFWHGKAPYVPFYNYKKPHDFLGTGEGDNIDGLCKEMNLQFQKLVGHSRKYADPNYTYDVNQISDDTKLKETFHSGGQMYPVDKMNATGPAIEAIIPNSLIPEVYQILGMIPKFIEEETGATDVSKGIASKKQRQSASEIAILVESSYTRTRQRVRNLEWSLKRVCWLLVNLMQQYYSEPRNYHVKENDEVVTDSISNSRAYATNLMVSPQTQDKVQAGQKLNEVEQQEWADYQKILEAFGDETDPVYFEYDVEIETNSSLPLDKQSLANLAVRLYQMKAIDRSALLSTLQFPHWEQIAEKLDQMEQQGQQKPQQPGGLPELNPEDISSRMQGLAQNQQGDENAG